jgi:alkylation response protein AidB-like acyl-CoA dehydrogenase
VQFSPTQDQLELREAARNYLRASCTAKYLTRRVAGGPEVADGWSGLVEMGLPGYLVSTTAGGLGMDAPGFALVAEESGYVALPEPLIEVAGVAAPLLDQLAGQQALAAEVCTGRVRVIPAHPLNPFFNQADPTDPVLLLGDEIRLVEPLSGLAGLDSIDPLRNLRRFDAIQGGGAVLARGDEAVALTQSAIQRGAVFTAAELLGLSAAMIDKATAYAGERKQFGKVIGSYQAIKHHLANAFVRLEFARPVVYRAAACLGQDAADLWVAQAKIAAIDTAIEAAEIAIQVHGAMGYTFEVELHLWMKRAWALAGLWGDRNHHLARVENALLSKNLATGPAATFCNHG